MAALRRSLARAICTTRTILYCFNFGPQVAEGGKGLGDGVASTGTRATNALGSAWAALGQGNDDDARMRPLAAPPSARPVTPAE